LWGSTTQQLQDHFQTLSECWDDIGLDEQEKLERENEISKHIETLMVNIIHQEAEYRDSLRLNVTELRNKVEEICDELHVGPPQFSNVNLTELEENLEDHLEKMNEEKESRLVKKIELEGELERLEHALGIEIVYTPQDSISTRCMDLLSNKTDEYRQLLDTRKATNLALVTTVYEMWRDLDLSPTTKIEESIGGGIASFQYTPSNLKDLESLHQKLIPRWTEKKEEIEQIKNDVKSLWSLLSTPQMETSEFEKTNSRFSHTTQQAWEEEAARLNVLKKTQLKHLILESQTQISQYERKCHLQPGITMSWKQEFTEEKLKECETELNRLKAMYAENQIIYTHLEKRASVRALLQEINESLSDTKTLSNRGGMLLKTTKKRDKLNAEKKKLEDTIKTNISAWETSHNQEFVISGQTFTEMLEKEKNHVEATKTRERKTRQREKAEQTEMELRYGHQVKTPRRNLSDSANRSRTPSVRSSSASFQNKSKRNNSGYQATPRPALGNKNRYEYSNTEKTSNRHLTEGLENLREAFGESGSGRDSLTSELNYSHFKHGLSDNGHSSSVIDSTVLE